MEQFTGNRKACASCEFWTGSRHVDSQKYMVESEFSARGECTFGPPNYKTTEAVYMCSDWEKWGVLK